ncbi:MAG: histidine kinase dimerization/phosphoacceptor domain -containing protein [Methanobacteriaceae archaeon]|jgi:PAS domain S-box-containing protein|nr:histidine kinase dimerization/phosphoacceptor domain -containing protein [Methanobacteriaceae archaeon]MDO9626161.1 histidine kinase dimerization/phosphoacceptor domain -containing protein [Methanobacteriaceae archaeon]
MVGADNWDNLRRKAEKSLRHNKEYNTPSIAFKDISNLIHEIQVHHIELEIQNEELRNSQIALESMNRKYFDFYNFAPIAYFSCDKKGIISDVNLEGASLLGLERNNLFNSAFIRFLTQDSRRIFHLHMKKVCDTLETERCNLEMIKSNGLQFHAHLETVGITDSDGTFKEFRTAIIDITEFKHSEDKINGFINAKDILLKETNQLHKNNLQIISNFLELQSKYSKDDETQEIFRECQNRIKSMTIIHEKLDKSDFLEKIDFKNYIKELMDYLQSYYHLSSNIKLILNGDNLMLNNNTAVSLGLIINELVTNSIKYAFPDGRDGEITVDFYKTNNEFILKVKDNGMGLPEDLDFKQTQSLGLKLVNSLTEQIDGEVELNKTNGTCFKIIFKEIEYK